MPKEKEPSYTIELSESQLKLVNRAIEGYFRLHMGQFFDYVSEISEDCNPKGQTGAEHNTNLNVCLSRRDDAIEKFEQAYAIAHPFIRRQSPEMQRLIDIWAQIRHKLWQDQPEELKGHGTDSYTPFLFSGDFPIHIRKEDDI